MNISFPLISRFNLLGHPANGMTPQVWFTLLGKFGFHWSMLPKVFTIGLITLLNYPFILMERKYFKKKISDMNVVAPIFILGHARSGTTFLHYLMSKDDQFATPKTYQTILPNSFWFLGWIFKPMLSLFMPKTRPMDSMSMGPDEPKEEEFAVANMTSTSFASAFYFPNHIEEIFNDSVLFRGDDQNKKKWQDTLLYYSKKICVYQHHNFLLLKSPYNTARIKEILEIFPDARFIHVARNPNHVLKSMKKLLTNILPILSFQKTNGEVVEDFVASSYIAVYKAYFVSKSFIPEHQLFEIKYEDLVKDPFDALKNIYKKFHLQGIEEKKEDFTSHIASYKSYKADSYQADEGQLPENDELKKISVLLGYQ